MGTRVELVLYAPSLTIADTAAAAAYDIIASLEQAMSDYRADSEVRRLPSVAPPGHSRPVTLHLGRVLNLAQTISQRTDGAFDVTVGPLVRLWRRTARTGELPDAARLDSARSRVSYRYLQVDRSMRHIILVQPDMRIDLGGIAKGYIADRALDELQSHGATAALVDAGGDLAIGKRPPGKPGWRVGAAPLGRPLRYLTLTECGVASSGDSSRGFVAAGRRWSHLIDPRTGWALQDAWSATVIADTCAEADALASAACVAGPAATQRWLGTSRVILARRDAQGRVITRTLAPGR